MTALRYRGRFAPSPTGALHFGSLVAAVGSWLVARHHEGEWLVRVEDIDPPREVPGSAASILSTLDAFGLAPDAPPVYQSQRDALYAQAFERLRDGGHLFPCWCSRAELGAHGGLHRDGRCIAAPDPSRPPAWRLRSPDRVVAWRDDLQGPQAENLRDVAGDFVIRRVEGLWSYQLACVVDDGEQGITHVVRGADLLDSTARQIALQGLLGLPTPGYLHLPLVVDAEGRKLSKSTAALPVDPADPLPALREALAWLGVDGPQPATSPGALLRSALERFAPATLRRSSLTTGTTL
ncbi:glutamyl-Q tRNA(Asp) synthetase [Luteibacter sp. UNCMF331Sha3.1]|uniref:tRNA glutamyl-Q(34) synthetase GluQRS n=1 Tax=Luteibacter sp. UNCMF331Sha3.1 TaxID=1502760 RepID=UPI0008C2E45E|nr:tRNA glutamyl-Q(34) synthetase GluQRS [Luteibacter sp. UNCMF331Sha3.1]SEM95393.1 glutamyl-Q tRNA(Asp) synthetase [Luteibacter sp. UNCMF331Sha3.1]